MTDEERKPDTAPEEQASEAPKADKEKKPKKDKECEKLKKQLEEAEAALAEQNDKYLRMLAEYDNFRRRAKEEKDAIYTTAAEDVLGAILPVIDNLERAASAAGDGDSVRKGVQMTLAQFGAALEKLGVSEVPCERFDPNLHNAVMHVEDSAKGESEIVEVLQKGYKKGDRIIRYAMVKVAN